VRSKHVHTPITAFEKPDGTGATSSRVYRFNEPSNFETVLKNAARLSLVWLGVFAIIAGLVLGRFFLAPIFLAVVIALMLVPFQERLARLNISASFSAAIVVLVAFTLITLGFYAIAGPLSTWTERLPLIWNKINVLINSWRETLLSGSEYRDILQSFALEARELADAIDGGGAVRDAASAAPGLVGQFLIFLASLYFFLATRREFRTGMLSLCYSRRLRLRVGRVFRDIENSVGYYVATITLINVGLGLATGIAMWVLGIPSPVLWGVLAALLNFVIYIGPATMAFILLLVGLSMGGTSGEILAPAIVFLGLNFIEANFITPYFIGRAMTMNPFVVFLALAFWIWIWGPVGGFIAVPSLLIIYSILRNVLVAADKKATRLDLRERALQLRKRSSKANLSS